MWQTLKLYLDSIKRFDFTQIYHLLLNRWIKKLLPFSLTYRSSSFHVTDPVSYQTFHNRFLSLFYCSSDQCFLWDIGINNYGLENHSYQKQIREKFTLIKEVGNKENITDIWQQKGKEETLNNLHRFHLFAEECDNLDLSPKIICDLIKSWIRYYPPSHSTAWNSFNATLRLFNWYKLLSVISREGKQVEAELWTLIRESIVEHVRYISDNIEWHVPGNHVLLQLYVIWISYYLLNADSDMDDWERVHNHLLDEFFTEYSSSGFHFEFSYHYHVQITLVGLLWIKNLEQTSNPVSKRFKNLMSKAVSNVESFILPDGTLPMIGDNCYTFFHDSLEKDVENIKELSKGLDFEVRNKKRKGVVDIENKYVIASSSESNKLIANVGNIGLKPNPGHGHSDILSMIYCSQGQPLFIDPGTFRYENEEEAMRLKKAEAHNTVTINHEDQAKLWSFFRWAYLPEEPKYEFEWKDDSILIKASYRGFKHIGEYFHQRTWKLNNRRLTIEDKVKGNDEFNVQLNFILSPGVSANHIEEGKNQYVHLERDAARWELYVLGEMKPIIHIEPFKVYPYYNYAVNSNRIKLEFPSVENKFFAQLSIENI